MKIITLTTDMGLKDYYVAALKGEILTAQPDVKIVDISHEIRAFDIKQAAFFIRNVYRYFPEGTIHIIGVDAEPLINFSHPEDSIYPLLVKYDNHYFLSADNGFFSLFIKNEQPQEIWRLEEALSNPNAMNFPTKNILIPAALEICRGNPMESIATKVEGFRRALQLSPVLNGHSLKGSVIHIDHYGNAITNVMQEDFQRMGNNVPFVIYFRQKEYYIDRISSGYNEVSNGEKVAIFNDGGHLEIAISKGTANNGGGARELFGLRIGDVIRVEFMPRGSRSTIDSLF